jgi:phosphopantothenoylcysteine decarboxylase/phosphopantothenate--cysteine ligase
LASLGQVKQPGQLLVGFALETTNEVAHALDKLRAKNADMIVLNSLKDEGAGFGHDTNKVTLLDKNGGVEALPLQGKQEVAAAIINHILKLKDAEKTV